MPANCQAVDTELTPVPPDWCPLLISQVSTSPVFLLSHRMSPVPSLLKSPLPSSCQALDTEPTPVPPVIWSLVISHDSTAPVTLLRHSASLVPLLSRSVGRLRWPTARTVAPNRPDSRWKYSSVKFSARLSTT